MSEPSFPDHDYLTVKELAELLRLKERKIYDLAARGEVPCSRATGKLLFPAGEIRAWIEGATSGGVEVAAPPAPRPPILLGSHDPLLDWALRQSQCGLASFYDGSRDGLERFARGEGMAAALHIHDAASDSWNIPAVRDAAAGLNAVLIHFATRRRGLVFRSGGTAPKGLNELKGLQLVPRQAGSGTDTLLQGLAAKAGLNLADVPQAEVARTEDDAVEAIRRGEGDVAFGLEAAARNYGLEFAPLVEEQFALLVDRKGWFEPQMQALMTFCGSEAFKARAKSYGGYDVAALGTVQWNA